MELKKKQIITSSLFLGLLVMPQVSVHAIKISTTTNDMTVSLPVKQQKKVVKRVGTNKSTAKRQAVRKTTAKKVSTGRYEDKATVNGVQINVAATDNMIIIFNNDENMSPNSVNFDGKIEDIRCYNHYVYVKSNVTDEYERRFTFYNLYKYDLITNKKELLLESCNDVRFDDAKHVIHTATITGMGLNGATYDNKDFNM